VTGIPRAQDDLLAPGLSARQKYARLVVGREGWSALLFYEFVQLASQWVPGALGLALRKLLYPRLLGHCGRNVVFGQHVVLRHPHKIHVGDDVVVDDHCLLDAKGDSNAGIVIGAGTFLGRNTILSASIARSSRPRGSNWAPARWWRPTATSSGATTTGRTPHVRCWTRGVGPRA
jgi:acetyltransferase-like isoleucine patch superfamily enzyme